MALVAVTVALAAVVFLGLDRRSDPRPGPPARESGTGAIAATVLGGPASVQREALASLAQGTPREDRPAAGLHASRPSSEARSVARRFVAALLRNELGDAPRPAGRDLRATSTPALARFVLARRPRVPAAMRPPARGELVALEPLPTGAHGRAELAATIERGGQIAGLVLELRRRGGRWWVSALR
jgi:hypothetical protein